MFVFQVDLKETEIVGFVKPIVVIENRSLGSGMTQVTMVDRDKIPADKKEGFNNKLQNYINMPKETAVQETKAKKAYSELLNAAGGAQFEIVVNSTMQAQLTPSKKDYVYDFSVGATLSSAQYRKLDSLTLAGGKPLVRDRDQPTYAEQQKIDENRQYVAIELATNKAYMVDSKTAEAVNQKHVIPAAVKKASGGYDMKGDARSFNPNIAIAYPLTKEGVDMVRKVGYDLPPQLLSIANIQTQGAEVKTPRKGVNVQ